jgi:hypothetical protein
MYDDFSSVAEYDLHINMKIMHGMCKVTDLSSSGNIGKSNAPFIS